VIGFLALCAALEHSLKKVQRVSECAAPFMILISFFQTLDLVLTVDIAWPIQIKSVAKTLSLFNFNLQLARPECSVAWSFAKQQWLTLATPLWVLMFIALFLLAKLIRAAVLHGLLACKTNALCRDYYLDWETWTVRRRPAQHEDGASVTAAQGHAEGNEDTSPAASSGVVATSSHAWPQLAAIPTEQKRSRQHWTTVRTRTDDVLSQRSLSTKLWAIIASFAPKVKVMLSSCMTVLSVFFLQPMVQGLDCIETADKRRFLDIEPATECDSSLEEYSAIERRSFIGMATWLAFATIFAIVVIRGGQSEFAFLAQKMKRHLFWWELLLILRKIIVMISVTGLSSRKVEAWFW
jgi:hypothetical protein